MKKLSFFAFIATSLLALGSLTSCHDEDLDVSPAVLQERAFEQGFIKEFGKPSANQSWDFYAQMMESLRKEGATRATMADAIPHETIEQPGTDWFQSVIADANRALEDRKNNANVGQQNYSLVSTGTFEIYAIHYGGYIEDWRRDNNIGFEFGVGIVGGAEQRLFGPWGEGDNPNEPGNVPDNTGLNPGYGAEVTINSGTRFYFYIKYNKNEGSHTLPRKFMTNHVPDGYIHTSHTGWGTTYAAWNDYVGPSTLLYTTEYQDENGKLKQYMVIGFEDGWGYADCPDIIGNNYSDPDFDYNDIIFVLAGSLPVPDNKRFFCEDLTAFDWDYNDVVFDLMNTGIVLRAVGGTLPVWLEITDRDNLTTHTGELHEFMRSKQSTEKQAKELTWQHLNEKGEMKTYYKPIEVAAMASAGYAGLNYDAVELVHWDIPSIVSPGNGKGLRDGEVEKFANPGYGEQMVGNVKLLVGTEYGQTYDQAKALAELDVEAENKDRRPHIVKVPENGTIPAIYCAPVNVRWMMELNKITLAYPGFYGGGDPLDELKVNQWWTVDPNPNPYTYNFTGDE